MLRLMVSLVLVVTAALSATGTPGAGAVSRQVMVTADPRADCPDVLVVGARGSGEKLGEAADVGRTVNTFVNRVRTVLRQGDATMKLLPLVDYPARSVGSIVVGEVLDRQGLRRYLAGVEVGVQEGVDKLKRLAQVCPDQRNIMVGYSQGAMVIHRAYLALPTTIRGRIAAVALIADPDRTKHTDSELVGAPVAQAATQGVYSYAFRDDRRDLPSRSFPRTRVWQICTDGDVVCDARPGTLRPSGLRKHTSYASEPRQKGLLEVVAGRAARAAGACTGACVERGRLGFLHPTWSGSDLVLLGTPRSSDFYADGGIALRDTGGDVVWSHPLDSSYHLAFANPPRDDSDLIFINYDPGRHNGVVVLRPVTNGFEDYGTLLPDGHYRGRFYYSDLVGPGDDGLYRIAKHTCDSSCIPGPETDEIYRFDGSDFVLDSTPSVATRRVAGGDITLEARRGGLSFRQGRQVAVRFHRAWRERDFRTMKRLAKPDRVVDDWFRTSRAGRRGPDCRSQSDERYGDHWYCYSRTTRGGYLGYRVSVVYDPSIAWRVTGAAPDV